MVRTAILLILTVKLMLVILAQFLINVSIFALSVWLNQALSTNKCSMVGIAATHSAESG